MKSRLNSSDLERIFHKTFYTRYNTRLQGGGEEPIYLPAKAAQQEHLIIYRHDYAASALHEVSHWCVAGGERRQLEDFGYWYAADGRSAEQQTEFERVEVRPQAFEWVFSVASGREFRVSADNLMAGLSASEDFKDAIYRQVKFFCRDGLPARAAQFVQALAREAGICDPFSEHHYQREYL